MAARLHADGPEAHPVPLRVGIAAAPLPHPGEPAAAAPAGRPVQRRLAGLRHPGRGLRRRQGRLAARGAVRGRRRRLPDVRRTDRAPRGGRGDLRRPRRAGPRPALDEPAERPFRGPGLHGGRADRGRGAARRGRVRRSGAHRRPGRRTRRGLVRKAAVRGADPGRARLHVRSVSPVTPGRRRSASRDREIRPSARGPSGRPGWRRRPASRPGRAASWPALAGRPAMASRPRSHRPAAGWPG